VSDSDLLELKRRLRQEGFEIYRTQAGHIALAERIRDNLILDSGIAVTVDPESRPGVPVSLDDPEQPLALRVTVRAQGTHFPGAAVEQVEAHAQALAEPFLARGYIAETTRALDLPAPGDPTRILDISYEVVVRRVVNGLAALSSELREAFLAARASSDA